VADCNAYLTKYLDDFLQNFIRFERTRRVEDTEDRLEQAEIERRKMFAVSEMMDTHLSSGVAVI
jgi:hypothetical protein